MRIGKKPGQVDCLQGNRDPMRAKLCALSEIYGAKAVAEKKALGDDTIVATKAVIKSLNLFYEKKPKLCEDEEEEHHGRITASMKWGEHDPDCTAISSGSFA